MKWRVMRKAVVLLLMLGVLSCGGGPADSLIQLNGAHDVKVYSLSGMKVLEYRLQMEYPAKSAIDSVSKLLAQKGWKPLEYLVLYPKYKSSNVEGWSVFPDPPKKPVRMIYEWSGNWQDANHNFVIYTFRYEDSYEKYTRSVFSMKPGSTELLVTAITMSEDVAKGRQIEPK